MRIVKHFMKNILTISPAILLTIVAVGGVRADTVSDSAKQEGWKEIIVAADPLMVKSVPTPGQLAYQTNQLGAFLHYGLAVYTGGDMFSDPDPQLFNPTQLDAEQWVRVAKSFGAKHLIFTAKHHSGFCLWPTKTTDYSVCSSPWKNGHGDVVREVADACKKHGIGLGIYYSGYDHHFPCYTGNPSSLQNREAYWTVYRQQIEELLTNYGDIVCLWLDGYNDPFLWAVEDPTTGKLKAEAIDPKTGKLYGEEIVALAKAKQPNIVICQGAKPESHGFSDEEGVASYPLWNVLRKGEGKPFYLPPWAEGWIVPEAHNCHGTFAWVPTTTQKLMGNYYNSIGRGANFLAAMVPDKRGLIDEAQAECWAAWGTELQLRFANLLAQTDSNQGWLEPGILEIDLGSNRDVAHIVLEEKIATGQHVLKYALDAVIDGNWKTIAEGQSIGRKRIERFQPAIRTEKIRLRIVQANAIPTISAMTLYGETDTPASETDLATPAAVSKE